jgi:Ser/Thr protein kinase RdoA (MazF antagonist)
MKLIGKGQHSDVFDNGDGTVLKVYRPDTPEALCRQDFEISAAVARHYDKAPAVLGLREMQPRPGIVLEKIDGPILLEAIGRNLLGTRRYARAFARAHIEIHGRSFEGLPPQKDYLLRELARAALPEGDLRDILEFTEALPAGDRLCHNDFMPTNVVLCERGVVAIDWRTASLGNPLADVARTFVLLEVPREDIGVAAAMDLVRLVFKRAYLAEYLEQAQAAKADFASWLLPLSAIRLGEGVSVKEARMLRRRIDRLFAAYRRVRIRDKE